MSKKELRKEKFNKECKWLFKKPIYHRGKFDNVVVYENTMEAYKKSIEDKAPFEFDVQITNDGQVICLHDTDLKRLFNRERKVYDISYKRLNKLRDELQVPLLKDVLKLVDGQVELMIELKHNDKRKVNKYLVKEVYELLKDYKGKYVLVSFDPFMLKAYKKLDKDAYVGCILSLNVKGFVPGLMAKKGLFNFVAKPDFISYDVTSENFKMLNKYKNKGYKITGWTLKDKTNIKELRKYYDNFIIEGLEFKEI